MNARETEVRVIAVAGGLRLCAPTNWERTVIEGVTFALRNPAFSGDTIFVGRRHAKIEYAERFLNTGIVPNESRKIGDLAVWAVESATAISMRTVVSCSGDYAWAFQLLYNRQSLCLFIVHWNGPMCEYHLEIAGIFDSISDCDENEYGGAVE
jgi:hypothetical protein